jgi:hypothetical protein
MKDYPIQHYIDKLVVLKEYMNCKIDGKIVITQVIGSHTITRTFINTPFNYPTFR